MSEYNRNPEMNPDDIMIISSEKVQQITRSLSETALSILRNIYKDPYIRQKDLAAAVHCSPSNLSNHLRKMKEFHDPLITSEPGGRNKYFSLTPIGKAYMEIMEREKEAIELSSDQSTRFSEYKHNTESKSMSMRIDNPNPDTKDLLNLAPLIKLEENNPETLYQVIDSVFSNLCLSGSQMHYSDKELYSSELTEGQYYALYFSLSKIIQHCLNNHLSKEDILSFLKEKLGTGSTVHTRYYIAAIIYGIHLHYPDSQT